MKAFCKKNIVKKTFFAPNVALRSFAYGKNIEQLFYEWKKYYDREIARRSGKFVLAKQNSIYGVFQNEQAHDLVRAEYPSLCLDEKKYELSKDGLISINGKAMSLSIGREIKAWAMLSTTFKNRKRNALVMIGKTQESNQMYLTVCELASVGAEITHKAYAELPITLKSSSFLICFDNHIFIVHDSTLHYYYYDLQRKELQQVDVGGKDEEKPYLENVKETVIVSDSAFVFWISEHTVYGLKLGEPARVFSLPQKTGDRALWIRSDNGKLFVDNENTMHHDKAVLEYDTYMLY